MDDPFVLIDSARPTGLIDSHFLRPNLLYLAFLPVLLLVIRLISGRRKISTTWPGQWSLIPTSRIDHRLRVRVSHILQMIGFLCLVLGVAGPHWGDSVNDGVAVGRDLVLVLDFSRSMWAEDMNSPGRSERWQGAVDGALAMLDSGTVSEGQRWAVVVFAAKPFIVVPLTTDREHVRYRLNQLDARSPPSEIRPDDISKSGTRIGKALLLATQIHDPRFPGYQDIVLMTDADDPVDDGEWKQGVQAANRTAIPIHVVGLGDQDRDSFVLRNDVPWEVTLADGRTQPVQTRLNESLARQIAEAARGVYIAARQNSPRLDEFFRSQLASLPKKKLSDDLLPLPRARLHLFALPAVALLAFAWFLRP